MQLNIRTHDQISAERVSIEVAPGQTVDIRIVDDSVSTEPTFTADQVAKYQASEAELVAAPLVRRCAELEGERDKLTARVQEFADLLDSKEEAIGEYQDSLDRSQRAHAFQKTRADQFEKNLATARDSLRRMREAAESDARNMGALRHQVKSYDDDRHVEQGRAREWKIRAEEAEKEVQELKGSLNRTENELRIRTAERDGRESARASQERRANDAQAAYAIASGRADDMEREADRANVARSSAEDAVNKLAGDLGKVLGAVTGHEIARILTQDWRSHTESDAVALMDAVRAVRRIVAPVNESLTPNT